MRRPTARPAANPSSMPSRMRAPAATRVPSQAQGVVARGTSGRWLPSVSTIALAAPLGNNQVVVWDGSGTGWLGTGASFGAHAPARRVTVLANKQGGPTGMLVQISAAMPGALKNPPTASADFVATPPDDPTAGCCFVQAEGQVEDPDTGMMVSTGGYISCPGGSAQWNMHGRPIPAVTVVVMAGEDGNDYATIETGDATILLPVCATPSTDTDDPQCCVDTATMTLVCADPSSPLHGAQVTGVLAEQPSGLLSVSLIDPRDGIEKNGRFMPCPSTPPPGSCCYDRSTNTLRCEPGDPRDGMPATAVSSSVAQDGTVYVIVAIASMGGQQITIPACPEEPPGVCCYDAATGTLRCPGNAGLNGQQVALVAMAQQPDGSVLAIVQIQGQSGVSTFPICEDRVSDCCYDAEAMALRCPNDASLDGTKAAVISSWLAPDQSVWVWAAWPGGGARMPLCPGQTECPPAFCCVNVETMRFVCPGRTEINGQAAAVVDIVTDGGFNWGVLADGSRIPLCGRDCPPPELCHDCPDCPPGMWTSPDGACVPPPPPPDIPKCPKGWLLDTETMQCVDCNGRNPPCPPYPGPMGPVRQIFVARGAAANPRRAPLGRRRLGNPEEPWWKKEGHCCEDCARAAGRKTNCGCEGAPVREANPSSHALVVNSALARALARNYPKWIGLGIARGGGTVLKFRGGASWTSGTCSPGSTLITIVPPGAVLSGVAREIKLCRPVGSGTTAMARRRGPRL